MDSIKVNKLRIAANQFYLGKYLNYPTISDKEYDTLVAEYESEGASVKDLVEWEIDMKKTHTPLPKVAKDQVTDNNLKKAANKYLTEHALAHKFQGAFKSYINYKYDGSSIIAYYNEQGKLYQILGTPDQSICCDRTRNCWSMFPHKVTPGIECIQGEFLVDAGYYGQLARNKANGLLNSKDMIDELESEGFIRVYQMRFYDGDWNIERLRSELNKLEVITTNRTRRTTPNEAAKLCWDKVFGPAEELVDYPTDSIITEQTYDYTPVQFQVDGVVVYSTDGYHAFKFYFTESAVTKVKSVNWILQDNGGWAPKLSIETVTLNGKSISQVASGGAPNLMYMRMGRGASVRVILSNMTIPKIVETIEPSEDYQWPVCECGYQTSEKDIFGSSVKCGAKDCDRRFRQWYTPMKQYMDVNIGKSDRQYYFVTRFFSLINQAFNIDRWDAKKQFKLENSKLSESIMIFYDNLRDDNELVVKELMTILFNHTDLTRRLLDTNFHVGYRVLRELIIK